MNPVFKTKRGGFHDPARQQDRRSAVLILTLAILTIITLMLIAFVAISSQDRGATQNYAQSMHAEQIGLGGLDQVVAQLQSEITDAGLSTTNFGGSTVPIYVPKAVANAVPQRMANLPSSLPTLVKISTNETFFTTGSSGPANSGFASPSLSTSASLNGRKISVTRWNKPQLLTTTSGFPAPNWVIVTRRGPQVFTTSAADAAKLANSSLGNASYAIGRYAYAVYDTSGLININVAGTPSSATSTNTGLVPFVDLTQLNSGTLTGTDIDNLIKWRNGASYPNVATYSTYTTNSWATNGFMQVAPGDTAFLSRQELIKYAQNQNTHFTTALPYLTTFSREFNGPSWMPLTNMSVNSGKGISGTNVINGTNAYSYVTLAQGDGGSSSLAVYNPFLLTARVKNQFTRHDGTTAVPGEPLLKSRFPLSKLNLFNNSYSSLTSQDLDDIARYFGLDPVTADASSTYHHWVYPTTNAKYLHTTGNILSLNEVGNLSTGREPDFFELLQAGILQGSLGYPASERFDDAGSTDLTDPDLKTTYQILRIGANIIDQWKSDNYPTTIQYTTAAVDLYGTEDLPYINQVLFKLYDAGTPSAPGPFDFCLYYEMWNPHQPSTGTTTSPTSFRITPVIDPASTYNDNFCFRIGTIYNNGANHHAYWDWSNAPGGSGGSWGPTTVNTYPGSQTSALYQADAAGTINFNASASDYREPALIANGSGSSSLGSWTPSSSVTAILLVHAPAPPDTMTNNGPTGFTAVWGTAKAVTPESWFVSTTFKGTLLLQYQDSAGWHTYGTLVGLANGKNQLVWDIDMTPAGAGASFYFNSASVNAYGFVKSDPRTMRFGPGCVQNFTTNTALAGYPPYASTGSFQSQAASTAVTSDPYKFLVGSYAPFIGGGTYTPKNPYRMDMWSVNKSGAVYYNSTRKTQVTQPATNAVYQDSDGAYRGGDAYFSYPTTSPLFDQATTARPIILHRPFQSVGEMGYALRDDPWRTLDLFTPDSADAALLDLFTLSDTPIVADRVNPNTPYAPVLAALLSGAPLTNSASTVISSANALSVGTAITTITSVTPIMNRAGLVTSLMTNSAISSVSNIKTQREAAIRALAESANTRTWNFMIDIIAQSGNYPPNQTAAGLDNFMVTGERRYWLHIAIDRYTGQVVDKQLEVVNE